MRSEFPEPLLTSNLSPEVAREHIRGTYFKDIGQFIQQLWRDLSVQGHIQLIYMNQEYRDELYPSEVKDDYVRATVSNLIDLVSVEEWARKSETFNLEWAREVLINDGENFSEFYSDLMQDEEFPLDLLGYAAGKGLGDGDLQLVGKDVFNSYLPTIYNEHIFYNVELEIFGDVLWDGPRYSELSPDQQMYLVTNFLNSRQDSDQDWANVVAPHLLNCIARHDRTADNVKAFILLNLTN